MEQPSAVFVFVAVDIAVVAPVDIVVVLISHTTLSSQLQ